MVLVIILFTLGFFIGLYAIYLQMFGKGFKKTIESEATLDIASYETERIKGVVKTAGRYATHYSAYKAAETSGIITNNSVPFAWIYNGLQENNPWDYIPTPQEVSNCLCKHVLYIVNSHLQNVTSPFFKLKVTNFTNCSIATGIYEVLSGEFDEYIPFSIENASIYGTSFDKSIRISDKLQIQDKATLNRFWYMYRVFYEWARNDTFFKCISTCACSCDIASCLPNGCVEDCAESALQDLQNRFDADVKCFKSYVCCEARRGSSCACFSSCQQSSYPSSCIWHTKTFISCRNNTICSSFSTYAPSYEKLPSVSFDPINCECEFYLDFYLSTVWQYTCIDTKYYIPTSQGTKPLKFTVMAVANIHAKYPCPAVGTCSCPVNATSCDECTCPCAGCSCYEVT